MAGVEDAQTKILIAGGGVAALETTVALRKLAGDLVDIELLAPDDDFFYRPLAVAEPFGAGQVQRFPLASLAVGCGARHVLGSLVSVSAAEHRVRTARGADIPYDVLVLATGARPREAIPGALTFRGHTDVSAFASLLADLDARRLRRVVFALPHGAGWPLPLYELAVLTAERLAGRAELELVTPEDAPLALFGPDISATVADLLAERGVAVRTREYPQAFRDGVLELLPGGSMRADAVVALPVLRGLRIAGVPQDALGFVPTDPFGRVDGLADVYAAGDATAFPVKQGGLATQQADAVAETIAAAAGAPVTPRPFEPVLRAVLLTGGAPAFLRSALSGGHGEGTASEEALWWPAAKIAGRYLAPYLAEHVGLAFPQADRVPSLLLE